VVSPRDFFFRKNNTNQRKRCVKGEKSPKNPVEILRFLINDMG
jgi:hypothetical protein